MPANECVPIKVPGESITAQATATSGGKRFCKISAARVGGGIFGGTSKVTTAGPGYGANTLSTDTKDVVQIVVCGVAGEAALGVNGWDLATGDIGKVYTKSHGNVLPIICGANLTAGQEVMTDANGAAIPWVIGSSPFNSKLGYALDAATSGADAEILLY